MSVERKTPIKHEVRHHLREGKTVRKYTRGRGSHREKVIQVNATPLIKRSLKKEYNLSFYRRVGRGNIGVHGSAIEYLTDGKISGDIVEIAPMTKMDESFIDIMGRRFLLSKRDDGRTLHVRDYGIIGVSDSSEREWDIPLKKVSVYRTRINGKLSGGWTDPARMTTVNMLRTLIYEVLIPLKQSGQFFTAGELSPTAFIVPAKNTKKIIQNESTYHSKMLGFIYERPPHELTIDGKPYKLETEVPHTKERAEYIMKYNAYKSIYQKLQKFGEFYYVYTYISPEFDKELNERVERNTKAIEEWKEKYKKL